MREGSRRARARGGRIGAGLAAWLLLGTAALATPPDRPLPDFEVFRKEVRARLGGDPELESRYTYLERREEIDITPLGKVEVGSVRVYEVYPSRDPGNTWKRLISVDGEPLSPEELAENDREHREDLEERRPASESERREREREAAEQRQEQQAAIDDLFRLYDIRMVRREQVNGHPTILFSLEPRNNVSPRTDEGEVMQKVRVRAWVHEFEYEVVRAEAEVLRDITWAWGLIGRVHAGSTARLVRTKVNDEVWLPLSLRYVVSGRSLMFRPFDLEATTRWWGHRRIDD